MNATAPPRAAVKLEQFALLAKICIRFSFGVRYWKLTIERFGLFLGVAFRVYSYSNELHRRMELEKDTEP